MENLLSKTVWITGANGLIGNYLVLTVPRLAGQNRSQSINSEPGLIPDGYGQRPDLRNDGGRNVGAAR